MPSRSTPDRLRFEPYRLPGIQGVPYGVGRVPAPGGLVSLAMHGLRAVTVGDEPFTIDPHFG